MRGGVRVRKIWFQFVRKEMPPKVKSENHNGGTETQPAAEEKPKVPVALRPAKEELALRLSGWLWVVPAGPHVPVVLTGTLKGWNGTSSLVIEDAALHLGRGEMRQLSVHLTEPAEERTEASGFDLPLIAEVRSSTSLAALRLGGLTLPESFGDESTQPEADEEYAQGTAVVRCAAVSGSLYDEPFRVRLIEFDQVHLVQGDRAWMGRMFQSIADRVPRGTGRALYHYLRRAASAAELLPRLRQAAERLQQTDGQGGSGASADERNDKARQEVQDGQYDEHDG